jgi:hypothetical protein
MRTCLKLIGIYIYIYIHIHTHTHTHTHTSSVILTLYLLDVKKVLLWSLQDVMDFASSLGYRLEFFNFSNKMKFHEDLVGLKKLGVSYCFFCRWCLKMLFAKMSHFFYFRQFAAEEREEADFKMTLIVGASENIWNTYRLTTCTSTV